MGKPRDVYGGQVCCVNYYRIISSIGKINAILIYLAVLKKKKNRSPNVNELLNFKKPLLW